MADFIFKPSVTSDPNTHIDVEPVTPVAKRFLVRHCGQGVCGITLLRHGTTQFIDACVAEGLTVSH